VFIQISKSRNLQNIINAIDPTNEELGLSSVKPLVTVIDQPYIKSVDLKKIA